MNFGTYGFPVGLGLSSGLFGIPNYNSRSLWTPASIPTQLWLDAADNSTITTVSGLVSQWSDKSGDNRNVLQTISSYRPAYRYNTLNNLPSLMFDGTDDFLSVNVINTQNTNTSTFIVSRPSSVNAKGYTFKNGASTGYALSYGNTDPTNLGNNFIYTREGIQFHPSSSYGGALPNIVSSILGSTNIVNYLNGINIQTISALPLAPSTETVIGGQLPFNGDIFEIVFCSSALSTIDRQKIEGYLAHKWGIVQFLSDDHPYKIYPPYI